MRRFRLIERLYGRLKASVTIEEDRMGAVLLQVSGVNQEHGDLGSVLTGVENLTVRFKRYNHYFVRRMLGTLLWTTFYYFKTMFSFFLERKGGKRHKGQHAMGMASPDGSDSPPA